MDLEIPEGQVLALIGPSGAGKYTLIRCINRLVEPTSGNVYLGNTELTGLSSGALRKERRRMRLICELCKERGLAAIINIPNVALAQMFVQRVIGLSFGAMVYDGPPDGLSPDKLAEIYGEEDWEATIEAITTTGASRWQVMAYGIVPQILPAFASIAVVRWDINIRENTVLGLVGAGGIGLQLSSSLNVQVWPQVSLILLIILAAVVILEWVSAKVRGATIWPTGRSSGARVPWPHSAPLERFPPQDAATQGFVDRSTVTLIAEPAASV